LLKISHNLIIESYLFILLSINGFKEQDVYHILNGEMLSTLNIRNTIKDLIDLIINNIII